LYQDRTSRRTWKNDARIRAYAEFIERVYEFDRSIDNLFGISEELLDHETLPENTSEFRAMEESLNRVALARAAVIVTGPDSLFTRLETILGQCIQGFDRIRFEPRSLLGHVPERGEFTESLHNFAVDTQRVLKTKT
jgi:hypothetical protein